MDIFLSLIFESLSCIVYGIIITAFIMVTLYFVLKMLSEGIVRSIPFLVTGPILAILLLVNTTVMVGAFKVKSLAKTMNIWLTQQLNGYSGIVDVEASQEIGEMLEGKFPILSAYLNIWKFSGTSISDLPNAMTGTITDAMNSQICSNILWSLGGIVVATLVALYFDKGQNINRRNSRGIRGEVQGRSRKRPTCRIENRARHSRRR